MLQMGALSADSISSYIHKHDPESVFICSYADEGMWIPTFANRATVGTHIHFIHEINHVRNTLMASSNPKYYFITTTDKKVKTPLFN
jgi:hypothetical protein